MVIASLGRNSLSIIVAIALLAGCGGSQPIGAPGVMAQSRAGAQQATGVDRDGSWISPEASSEDLLYVSNVNWASVYSYPNGKLVGKLKGFSLGGGICISKESVFIADGVGAVYQYMHGGKTRIRTYHGPGGALGCAVDPKSGNLAVATIGDHEFLYVFEKGKRQPKRFRTRDFNGGFWYCWYDNKGNLFVDGLTLPGGTGDFVFGEVPKGGSTIKTITLDQYVGWPGGIQWDGKYIVVADQVNPVLYRVTIKGPRGTVIAHTALGKPVHSVKGFFVKGATVIVPNACDGSCKWGSDVLFYDYPAGGDYTKKIIDGVDGDQGAAISLAPHR